MAVDQTISHINHKRFLNSPKTTIKATPRSSRDASKGIL